MPTLVMTLSLLFAHRNISIIESGRITHCIPHFISQGATLDFITAFQLPLEMMIDGNLLELPDLDADNSQCSSTPHTYHITSLLISIQKDPLPLDLPHNMHVGITDYHAYCLFQRILPDGTMEPTILLCAGQLLQQYVVDSFASAEQSKLRWIKTHQTQLRTEYYSVLADTVAGENIDARQHGKRIILSSSFIGPRHMCQLFQDTASLGNVSS